MLNLAKFILKRMLLNKDKVKFALSRMFPPYDPKLSMIRIKNFISTYLAWKYGLKFNTKPIILQIEPVKGCNLNCVMCSAGQLKLQKLSFDDFKNLIDKLPEAMFITLNYGGEPFLSKDTLKMIKYAQKKTIIIIFSNFTVLPNPEEIINSGLYEINASIDSFDKEKYDMIRKGGELEKIIDKIRVDIEKLEITKREKMKAKLNELYEEAIKNQIIKKNNNGLNKDNLNLDLVIKNLKALIQTKQKLKRKLPIISISAVSTKETMEDAEQIITNSIELGVDRVKFQKLAFDVPGILHMPDKNDFLYLQSLKEKYKDKIEISLVNFEFGGDYPKGYCYLAHFMATIDVNKNIIPCCMPYPYMDMNDPSFGTASSDEGFRIAIENRQKFIENFRKHPPNFCIECPLYFRK